MSENVTATQVIAHIRRVKLCQASSGARTTVPKVVAVAFGTGGTDEAGVPIMPDENATELVSEVARYDIDKVSYPADTSASYEVTIPADDLGGVAISEAALVDAEGDFVAIKHMSKLGKDVGTEFVFEFVDKF